MADEPEPEWVEEYRRTVGTDPPGHGAPQRTPGARASAIGSMLLGAGGLIVCGVILLVVAAVVWAAIAG